MGKMSSTDDDPTGPTAAELAATALAAELNALTPDAATATGATVTVTDDVTVASTVTVPSGVTLALNSGIFTVEDTLTVAGAVNVATGGTLDVRTGLFTGSTGTIINVASGGKYVTEKTGP
jgi:hypothetical protein